MCRMTIAGLALAGLSFLTPGLVGGEILYTLKELGTLGGVLQPGLGRQRLRPGRRRFVHRERRGTTRSCRAPAAGRSRTSAPSAGPTASAMPSTTPARSPESPTPRAARSHAFLSGPDGGPLKDLGTLPGGIYSEGQGVNASGQVAGYSYTAGDVDHAFLSGPGGGPLKDLGTPLGRPHSFGYAVNDSGQVAGESSTSGGGHAFLSGPGGGAPRTSARSAGPSARAMPSTPPARSPDIRPSRWSRNTRSCWPPAAASSRTSAPSAGLQHRPIAVNASGQSSERRPPRTAWSTHSSTATVRWWTSTTSSPPARASRSCRHWESATPAISPAMGRRPMGRHAFLLTPVPEP